MVGVLCRSECTSASVRDERNSRVLPRCAQLRRHGKEAAPGRRRKLRKAIASGNVGAVRALLQAGRVSPDDEMFRDALANKPAGIALALIEAGAPITALEATV